MRGCQYISVYKQWFFIASYYNPFSSVCISGLWFLLRLCCIVSVGTSMRKAKALLRIICIAITGDNFYFIFANAGMSSKVQHFSSDVHVKG